MTRKFKHGGLLLGVLILGYIPFIYEQSAWLPHDPWVGILLGPVATALSAMLVGVAASRFSKWWLLALIAPFCGMLLLMTANT